MELTFGNFDFPPKVTRGLPPGNSPVCPKVAGSYYIMGRLYGLGFCGPRDAGPK